MGSFFDSSPRPGTSTSSVIARISSPTINEEAGHLRRSRGTEEDGRPFFLYIAHTAPTGRFMLAPTTPPIEGNTTPVARCAAQERMAMGIIVPGGHDRAGSASEAWRRSQPVAGASNGGLRGADRIHGPRHRRRDDALRDIGEFENTMIVFLADNGGCAEEIGSGWRSLTFRRRRTVVRWPGNIPAPAPGSRTAIRATEFRGQPRTRPSGLQASASTKVGSPPSSCTVMGIVARGERGTGARYRPDGDLPRGRRRHYPERYGRTTSPPLRATPCRHSPRRVPQVLTGNTKAPCCPRSDWKLVPTQGGGIRWIAPRPSIADVNLNVEGMVAYEVWAGGAGSVLLRGE